LLYAIGEIVLVVLGILIALQINNWNDERKKRIDEAGLLKDLVLELQTNIKHSEQIYIMNKELDEKLSYFIKSTLKDQKVDYDVYEILSLGNYIPPNIRIISLEVALQGNVINIFKSDSLVSSLRNMSADLQSFAKTTTYLDESWNNRLVPFFEQSGMSLQQFALYTDGFEPDPAILDGIDQKALANILAYHAGLQTAWTNKQQEIFFQMKALLKMARSELE
jgi:hypothetical protein